MATSNQLLSGASCVVQLKAGSGLPNIPGSLLNDVKSVGTPLDSNIKAYKVSQYIKNIWGESGLNKLYSTLNKKPVIYSRLAYYFNGAYPSKGNSTYAIEVTTNSSDCFEYYVGSNVYFISRNSHRHSYLNKNTSNITITVTYTDNTTYSAAINNRYVGATHDPFAVNGIIADTVYKTEKLPKAIRSIKVVVNYYTTSAQWHDDWNRSWYQTRIINEGRNSFPNNFYGNYHLENKINFAATSGYLVDELEEQVTMV